MVLYMILIFGGDFIVLLVNCLMHRPGFTTLEVIISTLVMIPALIAVDGFFAFVVRRMPEKWFCRGVKFHAVPKIEYKFYEKLGIKHWKDYVLELGTFTSFSKKHLSDPDDPAYLERFILEANYGAVGHIVGAFGAAIVIFCYPNWQKYFLGITLPCFCINFVCSMLPYMVLRYNIPRLERMCVLAEKKKARAEKAAAAAKAETSAAEAKTEEAVKAE